MQDLEAITDKSTELTNYAMDFVMTYGPKLLGAIVVLVIGLWIIGWIQRVIKRVMTKANVDESLRPFLQS